MGFGCRPLNFLEAEDLWASVGLANNRFHRHLLGAASRRPLPTQRLSLGFVEDQFSFFVLLEKLEIGAAVSRENRLPPTEMLFAFPAWFSTLGNYLPGLLVYSDEPEFARQRSSKHGAPEKYFAD